jgi:hypothetical protein
MAIRMGLLWVGVGRFLQTSESGILVPYFRQNHSLTELGSLIRRRFS